MTYGTLIINELSEKEALTSEHTFETLQHSSPCFGVHVYSVRHLQHCPFFKKESQLFWGCINKYSSQTCFSDNRGTRLDIYLHNLIFMPLNWPLNAFVNKIYIIKKGEKNTLKSLVSPECTTSKGGIPMESKQVISLILLFNPFIYCDID